MARGGALVAGVGIGTGLSYFFDADRGARRRARMRDAVVHTTVVTRRAVSTTSRDAVHRTYGAVASLRNVARPQPVDDCVLCERVRAKLGRVVSHPHAIGVMASDGTVRLRGLVLAHEAEPLLSAVRHVRGVREVVDQLERHSGAENIPSLQGGRAPAGDHINLRRLHWAPATRAAVTVGGSALMMAGARRRGLSGGAIAAAGALMVLRATANLPLYQMAGLGTRRRTVDVQKTITINAPVGEVYAFWSVYENFPRFMSRVLDVTSSAARSNQSHWKVAGPAGIPVAFDAEMTRSIPNQLVAWKTLPGAAVAHAGIVRFDQESPNRTRVHIRMSYNPPAGWFGHAVATVFGVDPKRSMDEDLARMKTLIETGRAPHDAARRV
jgi:uncharacterized membrane protein